MQKAGVNIFPAVDAEKYVSINAKVIMLSESSDVNVWEFFFAKIRQDTTRRSPLKCCCVWRGSWQRRCCFLCRPLIISLPFSRVSIVVRSDFGVL